FFSLVGIDGLRRKALQSEHHGTIRGMADAGKGERAMQADGDARNLRPRRSRPVTAADFAQETFGRHHRSHRMRTGRSDTDLEKVEDRKEHGKTSLRNA